MMIRRNLVDYPACLKHGPTGWLLITRRWIVATGRQAIIWG